MQPSITLSVIVPVYNERLTVRRLLDRVREVALKKEIIVVDDGSTDGTRDILRQLESEWGNDPHNRLQLVFHEENAGKGAAIRTGIAHVSGDITLVQDADLEYDPAEYPQLIAPIVNGQAEVVYGSRFLSGPHRVLFFWHTLGNRLLTLLSNLFTDLNLTDMETCYKVFRTDVLRRIRLVSDRFGIEPEITAKIARLGCRVYEVPISYHGREYWEGKKIGWRDGVSAVWTIVKFGLVDDQLESAGQTTRKRLHRARRYNEWIWNRIAGHVGNRVLEVGSGTGTFTRFLRNRDRVLATESDAQNLELLRGGFGRFDNVAIRQIDWEDPRQIEELRAEHFDTIVGMNVLEHLEDDGRALEAFTRLLPEGGRLILKVPALKSLFGEIDRSLGRLRRYDRGELEGKLAACGFVVDEAIYLNVLGAIAWYFSAVVLRRETVSSLQARFANLLAPWLAIEQRWKPRFGLSLLLVARKRPAVALAAPAARTGGSDPVLRHAAN